MKIALRRGSIAECAEDCRLRRPLILAAMAAPTAWGIWEATGCGAEKY